MSELTSKEPTNECFHEKTVNWTGYFHSNTTTRKIQLNQFVGFKSAAEGGFWLHPVLVYCGTTGLEVRLLVSWAGVCNGVENPRRISLWRNALHAADITAILVRLINAVAVVNVSRQMR